MNNILNYNFYIFDCDGVILNSNRLKSNAFAAALPHEHPDLVNEFVAYHKENGGISRYAKFKYYFKKMKNQVEAEIEIKSALHKFANIVSDGLLKCDYIPGVLEFIENLFKLNKQMFVVSGSDEKELNHVFMMKGIYHYFENIYGSPANKIENTKKVVSNIKESKSGLFFGDSKSDYDAANKFGLDFIFVSGFSEWKNAKISLNKIETFNDTILNK